MVFDFYTEYLQEIFVTYLQDRFTKMFGDNYLHLDKFKKLILHKEDLTQAWDLICAIRIISDNCDKKPFLDDIESSHDLKNRLYQVKQLRNRTAHGRIINCNDVYLFTCNVRDILYCFRSNESNHISEHK